MEKKKKEKEEERRKQLPFYESQQQQKKKLVCRCTKVGEKKNSISVTSRHHQHSCCRNKRTLSEATTAFCLDSCTQTFNTALRRNTSYYI